MKDSVCSSTIQAAGSGGALLNAAFDILQHQRQAQRYGCVGRTGCADGGLRELLRDVAPGRSRPALFRQVPKQRAHVGERLERHNRGDDQRPRTAADLIQPSIP